MKGGVIEGPKTTDSMVNGNNAFAGKYVPCPAPAAATAMYKQAAPVTVPSANPMSERTITI